MPAFASHRPLRIGIICYPSIGGSGIIACALGEELARRGHEAHFISYERPVRLTLDAPRVFFHPVAINEYQLFKYPDYTLPLSVKLAEVAQTHSLDVLHAHYAVPHATAALLACAMLPSSRRPRVVATLHGTDTTLLGRDPGYGPAIRFALEQAQAVTAVSAFLRQETHRLLATDRSIKVIPNFFTPRPTTRSRAEVRADLGVGDHEVLLLHHSNLRPVKRFDLLLAALALVPADLPCKLLVLAGADFSPFAPEVARLGLTDRIIVRSEVSAVEDYLQAANLGVFTSASESFCLSILEAMAFGCPSLAMNVGGIPEVIENGLSGELVPFGDLDAFAARLVALVQTPALRRTLGEQARLRASTLFSTEKNVDLYENLYRDLLEVNADARGHR